MKKLLIPRHYALVTRKAESCEGCFFNHPEITAAECKDRACCSCETGNEGDIIFKLVRFDYNAKKGGLKQ